jgi:predicted lipoprotein with Yx(FWY)xxD motif
MKWKHILLAGAAASAVSGSALASTSGAAPSARVSSAAKVELRHTHLGSILTTSSGLTLYEFTRDRKGEDSCMKVSGCIKVWPALESAGKPVAGPGVSSSLLSTITVAGGAKQVTYAGHALYTYTADSPGSTGYVGAQEFGGAWYALSAAGQAVK